MFRWTTKEGKVLILAQMETRHLFNSAKMLYNHLAERYGMRPVWFMHRYSDKRVEAVVDPLHMMGALLVLLTEIEHRGDLPDQYRPPYGEIIAELRRAVAKRKLVGVFDSSGDQALEILRSEQDRQELADLLDPNQ